ncbi:sigma-70 family RNA polymerase sigma factor [Patulibacter brassicae]|uniref:Sigma-70 family RNA polymerase sigma factor n=1 Tax=Patulibacter brassicae TaxID=1705717 RepID=A0ABU4VPG0_9ACTN|nr:sigma-70 family RNA polymerase sigma factor [Patulibacter brassicae]MDX8152929.1 sigma-70 family RNA polymerase sigma factor [Patulibacter brassicae]
MHATPSFGSALVVTPPAGGRSPVSGGSADRQLVERAAAGDHRAFELLVERHRRGLLAYATRMLGDHARAEDAVQETFVSALRALRVGQRPVHLRAWLHEIARRSCIDAWRGQQRQAEVSLDPEGLSSRDRHRLSISEETALRPAGDRESLSLLRSAFGELPALQHDVLVQRELEGRSPSEIADRLGVSRTVVEGQLARGRRALTVAYRALESGERCAETRRLCDAEGPLGGRDRRRLGAHARSCASCRRYAAGAGVDLSLLGVGAMARAALLLPLPLLRRLPCGGSSSPVGDAAGGVLSAKLAVGAALMAGGTGLVVTDVPPAGRDVSPRVAGTARIESPATSPGGRTGVALPGSQLRGTGRGLPPFGTSAAVAAAVRRAVATEIAAHPPLDLPAITAPPLPPLPATPVPVVPLPPTAASVSTPSVGSSSSVAVETSRPTTTAGVPTPPVTAQRAPTTVDPEAVVSTDGPSGSPELSPTVEMPGTPGPPTLLPASPVEPGSVGGPTRDPDPVAVTGEGTTGGADPATGEDPVVAPAAPEEEPGSDPTAPALTAPEDTITADPIPQVADPAPQVETPEPTASAPTEEPAATDEPTSNDPAIAASPATPEDSSEGPVGDGGTGAVGG